MTSSLLATAVALTFVLPLFALGEYLRERRERRERRPLDQPTAPARKDLS